MEMMCLMPQSNADDSDFTIVSPSIRDLDRWAGKDSLSIEKSQAALLRVRKRLEGSKLITGQEALDEHRQRHGPAAGIPAAAAWDPTPALHLQLRFRAWDELHPVAVLGICRLLRTLD
jgi:hypothetical protein